MIIMIDDHVVYAPVAIPYEEDCDCDSLSKSEILYASKQFMEKYQRIDNDHCLAFGDCPSVGYPVDSIILSDDKVVKTLEGNHVTLPSGSWILGVKVTDETVWKGIESREYTGFSLMGVSAKSGNRTTIEQLGADWVATAVSIVGNPCVPKAKFIEWESEPMDSKFEAFVASIKSALSSLESEPVEPVEEEDDDVVEKEEPVTEEEVVESVKADEEPIEITGEHVAEAIKAIKSERQEEYATKSDVQELKDLITTMQSEQEAEAIKSIEQAHDEEINSLKSRIIELENELKNVGQSKVIKDCGCSKKEVMNFYDFEDRDVFGRKI